MSFFALKKCKYLTSNIAGGSVVFTFWTVSTCRIYLFLFLTLLLVNELINQSTPHAKPELLTLHKNSSQECYSEYTYPLQYFISLPKGYVPYGTKRVLRGYVPCQKCILGFNILNKNYYRQIFHENKSILLTFFFYFM